MFSNLARNRQIDQSEFQSGRITMTSVRRGRCIDSSGYETRDNVGPFPTRGCTLDKLWRDQRYDEGNAAGINAE